MTDYQLKRAEEQRMRILADADDIRADRSARNEADYLAAIEPYSEPNYLANFAERALEERRDELSSAVHSGRWEASVATSTFQGRPMVERASSAWDSAMRVGDYETVEMLISVALRSTDPNIRGLATHLVAKVCKQHAERVTELRGQA